MASKIIFDQRSDREIDSQKSRGRDARLAKSGKRYSGAFVGGQALESSRYLRGSCASKESVKLTDGLCGKRSLVATTLDPLAGRPKVWLKVGSRVGTVPMRTVSGA